MAAQLAAQAKPKAAPAEDEHQLAEEIARAMENRPLMSRLGGIETARAEIASQLEAFDSPTVTANPLPPPIPSSSVPPPLPSAADPALHGPEEDDESWQESRTSSPRSIEWLAKARRERRRARLRQAGGWLATIAIGATIIGTTALMLQH